MGGASLNEMQRDGLRRIRESRDKTKGAETGGKGSRSKRDGGLFE